MQLSKEMQKSEIKISQNQTGNRNDQSNETFCRERKFTFFFPATFHICVDTSMRVTFTSFMGRTQWLKHSIQM